MGEEKAAGPFEAEFVYTEDVLRDFERFYLQKKETPLAMRVVIGVLGAVGAVYFGYMMYTDGLELTRVGYLLICSVMLVLAFNRGSKRPDDTLAKYRKYYLDRKATFRIDEDGLEMKLEDQKHPARTKFKEIYGLFDTDLCYYFLIKGRAYYILPRESVSADAGALEKYVGKKSGKRFQHCDLDAAAGKTAR